MNRIIKGFIISAILGFIWGCVIEVFGLDRYGFVLARLIPVVIVGIIVTLIVMVRKND